VNALTQPPWDDKLPAAPFTFTRMEAFYDWGRRSLRETYHDICVPIFPGGSEWSCDFLNTNGTAYLLQHADRAAGQPECCIFEKPWSPPAPDFLSHAGLPFLKNTTYDGTTVMWWQTTDVPPSAGGPFGYGYAVQADGTLAPYAFFFGGFWRRANGTLAQASTMQYYEDFRAETPPPSTWEVRDARLKRATLRQLDGSATHTGTNPVSHSCPRHVRPRRTVRIGRHAYATRELVRSRDGRTRVGIDQADPLR
jgi:hypothetical protein